MTSRQGYRQIRQVLEDSIRSGSLPVGGQFPTDLELMDRFGVSRVTIRRAVTELVENGMVVRHRGRGSFVARVAALPPVTSRLDQSARQLLDLTESWNLQFVGRATVTGTTAIRNLFGLDRGDTVEEFQALRLLNETILAFVVKSIPQWAAELIPEDAAGDFAGINAAFAANGYQVNRIRQSIGAQSAELSLADRLGVRIGSPLLRVTRVVWDSQRRPLSYTRAYFRADAFEYDMEFIDDSAE